eukprot:3455289-Heterocapsa_arctica.AAC.1
MSQLAQGGLPFSPQSVESVTSAGKVADDLQKTLLTSSIFTPGSASGSGLGRGAENTSAARGRSSTKPKAEPGPDDTTNPVGRPK